MSKYVPLMAVALLAGAELAQAQSLEVKKYRKEQDAYLLEKHTTPMQEKCGKIENTIDWSKFDYDQIKEKNVSTYGYCASAADNLYYLCQDEDAKPEIQKKIKKIVCKFGGTGKRGMTLKDGVLEWIIDWDASNNDDFIKAFLMKNL